MTSRMTLHRLRAIVAEKEKKLEELEERRLSWPTEKNNANIRKYNQNQQE